MLRNLNSSMEAFRSVVGQNRHFPLRDDVTMIDSFVDVVDRATSHRFAGSKRLLPCFESWKFGQKRWMNVQDSVPKCFEHRRFEDSHETGENDEFDASVAKYSNKFDLDLRL